MTKYSQFLPEFGTKGSWVYPDIPELVLDVIRFTLDPDPGRRWTAEQAAHFLKGKRSNHCSVSMSYTFDRCWVCLHLLITVDTGICKGA